MNSKNPKKWESLLNDSKFEERIVNKAVVRYNKEKRKNRLMIGALSVFLILGSYVGNELYFEPSELTTNLNFVVDELVSDNVFLYPSD